MKLGMHWNRETEEWPEIEAKLVNARPDPPAMDPDSARRLFELALAEARRPEPVSPKRVKPARGKPVRLAFSTALCGLAALAWFSQQRPAPPIGVDKVAEKPAPTEPNTMDSTRVKPPAPTGTLVRQHGDSRPHPSYHVARYNAQDDRTVRPTVKRHRHHAIRPPEEIPTPEPPVRTELAQVLVVTATNTEPAVQVNRSAADAPGFSRVAVYTPDDEGGGLVSEYSIAGDATVETSNYFAVSPTADAPQPTAHDNTGNERPYLSVECENPAGANAAPPAVRTEEKKP